MKACFDKATRKWFRNNIGAETTVIQCGKCGLFYKPSLKHICEFPQKCGDCKYAIPTSWGNSDLNCYVECTNKKHIEKWCKNETARKRQKTHKACINYERRDT